MRFPLIPRNPLLRSSYRLNGGVRSLGGVKNAGKFTHINEKGEADMVDVSSKQVTSRIATAVGRLAFSVEGVAALVKENRMKKGDVLATARIAGIMAAKNTSSLIPLCHPLPLTKVGTEVQIDAETNTISVRCTAKTVGLTGVEMEALVGATVTLATIYDMCKAVDRHMIIENVQVVQKTGGKHDFKLD